MPAGYQHFLDRHRTQRTVAVGTVIHIERASKVPGSTLASRRILAVGDLKGRGSRAFGSSRTASIDPGRVDDNRAAFAQPLQVISHYAAAVALHDLDDANLV
jgi:hypothetical protein